jgi:hypothetical protein
MSRHYPNVKRKYRYRYKYRYQYQNEKLNNFYLNPNQNLNLTQMEYPPSCWLIREDGLFETAVARPAGNLSVEVLAKVPYPKPYP